MSKRKSDLRKFSLLVAVTVVLVFNCAMPDNGAEGGGGGDEGASEEEDLPQFGLFDAEDNALSNGDQFDFGNVNVSTTKTVELIIKNTGSAVLTLSGSPHISLTDTDEESPFSIEYDQTENIEPSQQSSFEVSFAPVATDTVSEAVIEIMSNDSGNDPFKLYLVGRGGLAEINIKDQEDVDVVQGQEIDFGEVLVGDPEELSFTIANTEGTATLLLTGDPAVAITGGADQFQLVQYPAASIEPGGSTPFKIRFSPDSYGEITAQVSIASNDNTQGEFSFTVKGYGEGPVFTLRDPDSNTIDKNGTYDFGEVSEGSPEEVTFSIENSGSGVIDLTGNPVITFVPGSSSDFTVTQPLDILISSGDSTSFKIEFSPDGTGSRDATVLIEYQKLGDSYYFLFFITGKGIY